MESIRSQQSKPVQLIKLLFIILVFPLVVGFIRGFIDQSFELSTLCCRSLYWGIACYLLLHIFIVEPLAFYKKTQKSIQVIFGFFLPLLRVAYYVIPLWIVVLIGLFLVVNKLFKIESLDFLFFFLSGFFGSMHIVMVAKLLKTDKLNKLIDYLFVLFLILIINIFFFALNLKLYEPAFSVSQIAREGVAAGVGLARAIYQQLFVAG